eukprot:12915641-Prorocentrum_lima.AAC.1
MLTGLKPSRRCRPVGNGPDITIRWAWACSSDLSSPLLGGNKSGWPFYWVLPFALFGVWEHARASTTKIA